MTVKTKYLLLAIAIVLLTAFFGGLYIGHKKAKRASETVQNALHSEINRYVVEIDKKNTYITEKEQELKTIREALKASDVSREELRKLHIKAVNELTRLKVQIDTLLNAVPNTGTIIYVPVKDTTKQPCMILPFTFAKADQWLRLNGSFNNAGVLNMDLKINANLDIWTVQKKKKDIPSVLVTTDNPYLNVIAVKSIKLDTPKEKRFGIGATVGYGITSALKVSPFIGIGLNYNVIKF